MVKEEGVLIVGRAVLVLDPHGCCANERLNLCTFHVARPVEEGFVFLREWRGSCCTRLVSLVNA